MVYLLLKMKMRSKDFIESGSASWQLTIKPLKFRSVLAAKRQIWRKEARAMFHIRLFKKTKSILRTFKVKISLVGIKEKLFIIKKWFFGVKSVS